MIFDQFRNLLKDAITLHLSDVHIATDARPFIRNKNGDIEEVETFPILSREQVELLAKELLSADHWEYFQKNQESDTSYRLEEERFRVNVFQDIKGPAIVLRLIPSMIPRCEDIGISEIIKKLLTQEKGLIIVTWPTGSGKSTTLAAMIDYINTYQKSHIITIEDPIEFRFANKLSLIRQRELGTHTHSFPAAMRSCLREDPDVIMVGEMRDPETIATALALAETGHLILSTLHTNDAVQSIDRIVDAFPAIQQSQIRFQLSMMLTAIVSQVLLPRNDEKGRIVAREILLNNNAVCNTIRRGATHQLYSIMELSTREGMMLMDYALEGLYTSNKISRETFLSHARDPDLIANYQHS